MTIAQSMAEVFVEDRDAWNQRQDKRDRIDVTVLDSVWNLGYEQYSPNTRINTMAGALVGLLVGGLVVLLLEWLEAGRCPHRGRSRAERAGGGPRRHPARAVRGWRNVAEHRGIIAASHGA